MSEPGKALERRGAADLILAGGDMPALIEATKRNVEAAIQFAREREFVSEFPIERKGKVIGTRLFFHHPTWQLLGQSFGITAITAGDPVEVKPGTWQARGEAYPVGASRDTQPIGAAVALCSRSEPGKKYKSDHDLAATAQTRAQRNALRSALGAILIAAGFEIADPEGPATKEQVGLLWQLARELELDENAAHEQAGAEHFRDLNREQASDLIERWKSEVESRTVAHNRRYAQETSDSGESAPADAGMPGGSGTGPGSDTSSEPVGPWITDRFLDEESAPGAGTEVADTAEGEGRLAADDSPSATTAELMARAGGMGLTAGRATSRARQLQREGHPAFPSIVPDAKSLTAEQWQVLIEDRGAR
jgi:hypothetical protein